MKAREIAMDIFEKYDLSDVDESFPIPQIPDNGLIFIYGSSGSGKSTILRTLFNDVRIEPNDGQLYTNFSSPQNAEKLLISCGLRTIPSWRRCYTDLSNGEKHRAFCAMSLDIGAEYIDEFTSVVDRDTAKTLSFAIQKYYMENKVRRLIIASCHSDIIEWLNPDHIYNTDTKVWEDHGLPRGLLWRPKVKLTIRSVDGKDFWPIFKRHHYLISTLNKSSASFCAFLNEKPIGFSSILRFPNGNIKNGWREHRTVVLPEFQGIGIWSNMSDMIAQMVIDSGGRFFSKTAHPAFGLYREKSTKWKGTSKNKKKRQDYSKKRRTKEDGHKMAHKNRLCYSHEYIG